MESELRDGYKMTELGALPEEWDVVKLDDYADEITSGGTPSRDVEEYFKNGHIRWLKTAELRDKVIYDSQEKITAIGLKKSSAKVFPINTVLIAMYGATIGRLGILKKDCATNQACCAFICQKNSYQYLYYYMLKSRDKLISLGAGAGQPNISQNILKLFQLPLPPLPEQRRIATILSTLDETVEHTEALIEKYKNIKAGLMSDLLTRGIDEEGRIRSEGTHRFKDSVVGRVPEEWEVGTLSDIAQIEMGQSPNGDTYNSVGDGRPLLNGPAEFGVNHPSPVQWTSKPTKTCNSKDILFCVRGSTTGRMNVADQEYCIGRGIAAISGISNIGDTFYIKYILKHKIQYIFSLASGGGSTFPNITSKDLSNLRFTYPPLPEQRRIAEILTAADQRIEKEEAYRDKLLQLKKGLMQDLLTGKVRVKDGSFQMLEQSEN